LPGEALPGAYDGSTKAAIYRPVAGSASLFGIVHCTRTWGRLRLVDRLRRIACKGGVRYPRSRRSNGLRRS